LLLDEITEMHLGLQAKLLRVLQEREVEPLGANRPVPLDVRVLATSNRDLDETVRAGQFREDLYYRLSVFPLRLPALRERPADIAALANRFVAERGHPGKPSRMSGAALAALARYDWPGNVRELENVVQRALVLAGGEAVIEPCHLVLGNGYAGVPEARASFASVYGERAAQSTDSHGTSAAAASGPLASGAAANASLAGEMWEEESRRIVSALKANHGGRKRAAADLGISDRTLRYKLAKMRAAGIEVPGDRAVGVGV
jgi:two-component system response regulator FlrC